MSVTEDLWTSLSGISGSISLASWIVVLMPQLIENYHTKSYVSHRGSWKADFAEATPLRSTSSSSGSLEIHAHSLGNFSNFKEC